MVWLLKNGADIDLADQEGVSPFFAALKSGHVNVISEFYSTHQPNFLKVPLSGITALQTAVLAAKKVGTDQACELVTLLLCRYQMDPNSADLTGRTCLHEVEGNDKLVELLLKHGALVKPDNSGHRPVLSLVFRGYNKDEASKWDFTQAVILAFLCIPLSVLVNLFLLLTIGFVGFERAWHWRMADLKHSTDLSLYKFFQALYQSSFHRTNLKVFLFLLVLYCINFSIGPFNPSYYPTNSTIPQPSCSEEFTGSCFRFVHIGFTLIFFLQIFGGIGAGLVSVQRWTVKRVLFTYLLCFLYLPICLATLVLPFELFANNVYDLRNKDTAFFVLGATIFAVFLAQLILIYRALGYNGFSSTIHCRATQGLMRAHTEELVVLRRLSPCELPAWVSLDNSLIIAKILLNMYQLAAVTLPVYSYPEEAPIAEVFSLAFWNFEIKIDPWTYYRIEFGMTVFAVVIWLTFSNILAFSGATFNLKYLNSLGHEIIDFFASSLYLFIVSKLLGWLDCTYTDDNVPTLDLMFDSSTGTSSIRCWEGEHLYLGLTALILIILYTYSTNIIGIFFFQDTNSYVDVRYIESFVLIDRSLKFGLLVVTSLLSGQDSPAASVCSALAFTFLAVVSWWPKTPKLNCECHRKECYDSVAFCNIRFFVYFHRFCYISLAWSASVTAVTSFMGDYTSSTNLKEVWLPFIILCSGITLVLGSGLIYFLRHPELLHLAAKENALSLPR